MPESTLEAVSQRVEAKAQKEASCREAIHGLPG